MLSRFLPHLFILLAVVPCFGGSLQETWESGYRGKDATGPQVLGYWKFDGPDALKDISGKGNDLTLHGANIADTGKFGGGLESFPGFPIEDKNHGAITAGGARLSPKGAFSLELWVRPKPEFEPKLRAFLLDKKYTEHTDYQWILGDAEKSGGRRMLVNLGFGAESRAFTSLPVKLETGAWHHLAFTYNGAGEGRFFIDGQSAGLTRYPGLGAISPGAKPLSIGDRLGGSYGGFPGFIDEVRICDGALHFEPASVRVATTRTVWERMEKARPVEIIATNLRNAPMRGARLRLSCDRQEQTVDLPELAPGAEYVADFTVDTALKPGHYDFHARLESAPPAPSVTEESAEFQIVSRPLPHTLPVIMWGAVPEEIPRLKQIGFTHYIGITADVAETWKQGKPAPPDQAAAIAATRRTLDDSLANGLRVIANLTPRSYLLRDPKFLRVDRQGKPYPREDICASMPEIAPFFENVGRSIAQTYGDHPAFAAAMLDSEVRDDSRPSFNAVDVENYRRFSGGDIPPEVVYRNGVLWSQLKRNPHSQVIADDDPILKYYRWFWTVGDGWNNLHSALDRGLKSTGRRDLWTWFDPAVRQPSISGSGGSVDVLSHWTYTYPAPLCIGLCTDQLFAMSAASARHQQVMSMTQIIWYRSQTAPVKAGTPGNTIAWEDHDPDAAYITIAPIHLREAFWTKIARPVQGIMYFGWSALVDTPGNTSATRFTNPNSVHVLENLLHDVVAPLGPTLTQIPDERSEVAYFESFTSQMFAGRGTYGNNQGWAADFWLALQHAHTQCDVLYEETLLKDGLAGRKVLVMPECDVLTQSLVERIQDWQKRGGKIVADEFLCPALKADVTIPSFKRTKKADVDKARVLALAASLGPQLRSLGLTPKASCDNPEIVVRTRHFGGATYLFVVNDRREFGNYVGQYGLVMENGAPSSGVVTLPGTAASVYDLVTGQSVAAAQKAGATVWPVHLGPGEGAVYLIAGQPIAEVTVNAPETVEQGRSVEVAIAVTDAQKQPIPAVVPLLVKIEDANGREAEGSGYYGAANGALQLKLDLAANDDPGTWQITVRELASRKETVHWMRLTAAQPPSR